MPAIFEFQHLVTADDIDGQGHVNNLCYLKWMQDAAVAHSRKQGWDSARHKETGGGWVARSHFIEYLQPCFEDDEIIVHTWVANFKKITSLRKYKMVRTSDNAVVATAQTNWAYIGLEHRVPRRIPPEVRDAYIVVEDEQLDKP